MQKQALGCFAALPLLAPCGASNRAEGPADPAAKMHQHRIAPSDDIKETDLAAHFLRCTNPEAREVLAAWNDDDLGVF